jgi:hypothetical protein
MAARLPIVDVAATGLRRALESLPGLLAIYWLPWLLGTVVLLILEVVAQDQLRLGWAPAWARSIVWAPFAAMAYLMLLRWRLDGEAPARGIFLDLGRRTWVAAPVVGAWEIADAMDAMVPVLTWLVLTRLPSDFEWSDIALYLVALWLVAWLINGALLACLFGLMVAVLRRGWPDPRECWRLLRLQPMRLLCIALLATAAVSGLRYLGSHALAWLGADALAPTSLVPWRANIRQALLAELCHFPLHFLEYAIQGSIMAEAYRRLLAMTPRSQPPQA